MSRYPSLGVVGGLGPLASAAFLRSLYLLNADVEKEQAWGHVVVDSFCGYPRRTPYNLQTMYSEFASLLEMAIQRLLGCGCDKVVVCCCSLHHVVPALPDDVRQRLILLPDRALQQVSRATGRFALLCAEGCRAMQVYENSPSWEPVSGRVMVIPDRMQRAVQRAIESIKLGGSVRDAWMPVAESVKTLGVDGVILGCTELHLISEYDRCGSLQTGLQMIDPLEIAAKSWPQSFATETHDAEA